MEEKVKEISLEDYILAQQISDMFSTSKWEDPEKFMREKQDFYKKIELYYK